MELKANGTGNYIETVLDIKLRKRVEIKHYANKITVRIYHEIYVPLNFVVKKQEARGSIPLKKKYVKCKHVKRHTSRTNIFRTYNNNSKRS